MSSFSKPDYPAARPTRYAALVAMLLLPGLAAVCPAALYQTPQWALVGSAGGVFGYDSNLTLSQDGEGASFATFQPELIFKRISSSTKLEFAGRMALTQFSGSGQDFQADPALMVDYEYPSWEDRLPRFAGGLSWNRSTKGNSSVGERITTAFTHLDFGGRLLWTGKVGVMAQASYDGTDYQSGQFVDNQRGSLTVGVGYEPHPLAEYSLNLVSSYGDTDAFGAGATRAKNWEEGLTVRVRGQLSPKLTGSLYAGVAVVKYTGSFRRTDTLPLGGGELGWQVTPRGWIYGGLDFGADYSPQGESVQNQRVSLRYQQTILEIWRAEIGISPGRTFYSRQTRQREDRTMNAGLALTYEPSTRFAVRAGYEYTNQDSDASFANFDHHLLTVRLTSRF